MKNLRKQNKKLEGILFSFWLTGAISIFGFTAMFIGAWATRQALAGGGRFLSKSQSAFFLGLSSFPSKINTAVKASKNLFYQDPLPLLLDAEMVEKPGWLRKFPSTKDDGYLLLSGVDSQYRNSNVRIIRITDNTVLKSWNPNWQRIYTQISEKKYAPKVAIANMLALHPLPLPDGNIVFSASSSAIVKMSPCANLPEKVYDILSHHSIELSNNKEIITNSVANTFFSDNLFLRENLRDDSILRITFDGEVIDNKSFSKILADNNLETFLFKHMGSGFHADPIHLNQVSVAKIDGKKWKKGDYLISARTLSTIFLYRPDSNKIIWYQSGPWKNQHSVHFVDGNRIALFDNNVYNVHQSEPGSAKTLHFVRESDINRVFIIDFSSSVPEVSEPFKKLLESEWARPETVTQGIARVLPDGGLFIEETVYGRHLRFSENALLWSRVNDYDDQRIGLVSWSRYLTKAEGDAFLKQIREAEKSCFMNDL